MNGVTRQCRLFHAPFRARDSGGEQGIVPGDMLLRGISEHTSLKAGRWIFMCLDAAGEEGGFLTLFRTVGWFARLFPPEIRMFGFPLVRSGLPLFSARLPSPPNRLCTPLHPMCCHDNGFVDTPHVLS